MFVVAATAILKAAVTIFIWAVAFGIPALIVFAIMASITRGLTMLYKNFYWFNCVATWLFRSTPLRHCVANGFIIVPTLAVGTIMLMGFGVPTTNDWFWSKEVKPEVSSYTRQYILVKINPPKQVYVTIKDTANGHVYNDVFLGQHCKGWELNKAGDRLTVEVQEITNNNRTSVVFNNLRKQICDD